MLWVFAIGLGAALLGSLHGRQSAAAAAFSRPMSRAELARLNKLQPRVRSMVLLLKARLNAAGRDFFLGDTMRTGAEEQAHLAAGRSAIAVSFHQSGRAADIIMRDAAGRPDVAARDRDAYDLMHRTAQEVGLHTFGFRTIRTPDGRTFTDPYHVEVRDGLSAAQALARYRQRLDRSADLAVYA